MDGRFRLAYLTPTVAALAMLAQALPGVAGTDEIVIPVVTIYPGDLITDSQFRAVPRPAYIPGDMPIARKVAQVTGKTTLRVLPAGRPVPLSYLGRPNLVRTGMTVSVFYSSAGISIIAAAQALGDGAMGDQVRARNLQSGTVISGYVQSDGSLRVMP